MNLTPFDDKDHHRTEIVKRTQKEYKMLGSVSIPKGHRLFKINVNTLFVSEVLVDHKIMIDLNGKEIREAKVIYEKDHLYCHALNKKNAAKHFNHVLCIKENVISW